MDFRWVHARFLAQLFVVPENDRCDVVRQAVNLASHCEVLDRGRVKGVRKAAFAGRRGDVLANARSNLFVHHPAAPAVKSAGQVLGLEQGGQLGLESLVFQVVEFDFDPGVGAFEFLSGFLPNRQDFRIGLNMQDLDHRFGSSERRERS